MVIELRTWETEDGLQIPFFRLPSQTRAQFLAAINSSSVSGAIWAYNNPSPSSITMLSGAALADWRWGFQMVNAGWNPKNVFASAVAGSGRLLLAATGLGSGTVWTHTPGSGSWTEGDTWEKLMISGGSTNWVDIDLGSAAQFRPNPGLGFESLNTGQVMPGKIHVVGSDGLSPPSGSRSTSTSSVGVTQFPSAVQLRECSPAPPT